MRPTIIHFLLIPPCRRRRLSKRVQYHHFSNTIPPLALGPDSWTHFSVSITSLVQTSHNVSIDALQFSGVVASAMLALEPNEVIAYIAHLATILAVDITRRSSVGWWHWLHPHGRIKQTKVFCHVFCTLLTQWACVCVPSHVPRVATQVHHMSTSKPSEGLGGLEHGLTTDGTVTL